MTDLRLTEWVETTGVELTAEQASMFARGDVVAIRPDPSAPGRWAVRAKQHVGAMSIAGVQVRIRPKVDVRRLVALLVRHVELATIDESDIDWGTDDDVATALAGAFVTHAERIVGAGLLQGYRTIDEALLTIRGRIAMGRQVSARAGLALPVEVTHDEFTTDIVENRLLAGATAHLLRLTGLPPLLGARLRRLRSVVADVEPTPPGPHPPSVEWTRLNERYRSGVALARLVLMASTIEHEAGNPVTATGLLVDMNRLFEAVVIDAVRAGVDQTAGRVVPQRHDVLDHAGEIAIRPDVVVIRDGRPVVIADAKYKQPDLKGVAVSDVHQALAYAHRYGLSEVHLVYPVVPPHRVLRVGEVTVRLHHLDLDNPVPLEFGHSLPTAEPIIE